MEIALSTAKQKYRRIRIWNVRSLGIRNYVIIGKYGEVQQNSHTTENAKKKKIKNLTLTCTQFNETYENLY